MREFLYGLILGVACWYAYERIAPPAVLAYLNALTESAERSTSRYGGMHRRR